PAPAPPPGAPAPPARAVPPAPSAPRAAEHTPVTEPRRPAHDERDLAEPGGRPLPGEPGAPEQHLVTDGLTGLPLQPLVKKAFPQHSVS
ncbi:hypothetical protein ACFVZ2_29880, partial [Streptomyces lasiicapitis]